MKQTKQTQRLLLGLLAITLLTASSCSQEELINRGIGAVVGAGAALIQAQTLTPQVEAQLGVEVRKQVLKEYTLYTGSKELVDYVRQIVRNVASKAKLKDRYNFQFDVVDSTEINAFAIPGGSIFITTELLKYLKNEAELASVLGHEISHVDEEHTKESIQRAMIAKGIVQGGLSDSNLLTTVASLSADLILKGFSREQEKEADSSGLLLAIGQNYDPAAMPGFLQTLLDSEGQSSGGVLALLRSHPGTEERITLIRFFIQQRQITVLTPVTHQDIYLKKISVLPPKKSLPKASP